MRLLQFYKKVKKLMMYSGQDKLLIIKAFFITGIIRAILILAPFKKLKKHLGRLGDESSSNSDHKNTVRIQKIGWVVIKVSMYTPWESKCLVQALTAQRLLQEKDLESTLYFGVRKNLESDKIEAHAWIRCGDIYLTGGNGEGFYIVAKYIK